MDRCSVSCTPSDVALVQSLLQIQHILGNTLLICPEGTCGSNTIGTESFKQGWTRIKVATEDKVALKMERLNGSGYHIIS